MINQIPEATFSALVEDEVQGVTFEVHQVMLPYDEIKAFEKRERLPRSVSLGGVGELVVFSEEDVQNYEGGLLVKGEILTTTGELKTSVNFFYPTLLEKIAARIRSRQPEVQASIGIEHH